MTVPFPDLQSTPATMECDDGMLSAQEEADQYGEAELENANLAAGDTAYLCSTKCVVIVVVVALLHMCCCSALTANPAILGLMMQQQASPQQVV